MLIKAINMQKDLVKRFVKILFMLMISGLIFTSCKRKEIHPNIVFLFPDQYRTASVGFLGQDPVITPNIDKLASEGLWFSNATSTIPLCSPFRAMMLTGNYYTINNVPNNCVSTNPGVYLPDDSFTLLDALAGAGYDVGYIGKWHLEEPYEPYVKSGNNRGPGKGNWEEWTPPERRHGVKFWYAYNTFDNHFKPHYWTEGSTRDNRVEIDEWSPQHETTKAIEFIINEEEKYRDPKKPFAVFVSYNPPHTGYSYVPEKYKELYRDMPFNQLNTREDVVPGSAGGDYAKLALPDYFACVTGVDEQVGRLIKSLDDLGLRENTIVIFTSDHGNCLGAHNQITKNIFWEEAFSVPLVISWPGTIEKGNTDILFSSTDFFPTIASLAGINVPDVQGMNLSERILSGSGPQPAGALYAHLSKVKSDTLILGHRGIDWGERGIRTRTHMLVINKMPGVPDEYFLYDLEADPFQKNNIALYNRDMALALKEDILIPKLKEIGDGWWEIPESKSKVYPQSSREFGKDNPIWGLR